MNSSKDRGALPKLLSEAILQLCRVGVGLHGNFNIDGIICIENSDQDGPEIVVKIHEKINKGTISNMETDGQVIMSTANMTNVSAQPLLSMTSHPVHHHVGGKTLYSQSYNASQAATSSYHGAASKFMPSSVNSGTSAPTAKRTEIDFSYLNDSDCEILDDSTHKQLFGDLGNIAESDLGGLYDVVLGDISIKPDPARSKKPLSPSDLTVVSSKASDSGSDEELKIEKLTAGRSRKPHRARPAYRDVHGESVEVVSSEEYARILKSEKLKRSRDKSPEFPGSKRAWKPTPASVGIQDFGNGQGHVSTGSVVVGTSGLPVQIASVHDANIASISTLPINSGNVPYGNRFPIVGSSKSVNLQQTPSNSTVTTTKVIGPVPKMSDCQIDNKPLVLSRQKQSPPKPLNSYTVPQRRAEKKFLSGLSKNELLSRATRLSTTFSSEALNKPSTSQQNPKTHNVVKNSDHNTAHVFHYTENNRTNENKPHDAPSATSDKALVCYDDINTATQSKPHKCPFCTQIYDTFKLLDLHMYQAHRGNFMCPLCGKLFKQRSTRNRHIVAVHSQTKNFACSMCSSTFTRVDSVKKHFLTQHPEIHVPKFPYSYKRGETIARSEPMLEIKQDMAETDVTYIEEHLMRSVRSEKDLTALEKLAHSMVSDSASEILNSGVSIGDAETEAAVEVIALDSDDQFDAQAYVRESATDGEVLDDVEEVQVELVSVGVGGAVPAPMEIDEPSNCGFRIVSVASDHSTNQFALATNTDNNTPVSFSPMSEGLSTDSGSSGSTVAPSVSTGNTVSILPSTLVSRLKNADMRRFVTVIQAKNRAQDKKKIDFRDTIMRSSYTAVSSYDGVQATGMPFVTNLITNMASVNESDNVELEVETDDGIIDNTTTVSVESLESECTDSSRITNSKSNVIPHKSIENCKSGTAKSKENAFDETESISTACQITTEIEIISESAESEEQNKEIQNQRNEELVQTSLEVTENEVHGMNINENNQPHLTNIGDSTCETNVRSETVGSTSTQVPDVVNPPVYFRQVLVPTHTVEVVEPGSSIDALPAHTVEVVEPGNSLDTLTTHTVEMVKPGNSLDALTTHTVEVVKPGNSLDALTTHTVEVVEPGNSLDALTTHPVSTDTLLSTASGIARLDKPAHSSDQNDDTTEQNAVETTIDTEETTSTHKESSEDSINTLVDQVQQSGSSEGTEVRSEQAEEGHTAVSAEQRVCAIEISDEEMETGD